MTIGKFILICIAALLLNLIGASIVEIFGLPLYLDTSGTIFIAALGGYVPGIAVGFFTNLFKAIFDSSEMYYCTVSIVIAIFAAYFARKNFFNHLGKVLILIPFLTLLSGTFDLLIENFLHSADFIKAMTSFELSFSENLRNEFIDKTFSILLAFWLLNLTPTKIK